MGITNMKKRKVEAGMKGDTSTKRPSKKSRKLASYHSDSSASDNEDDEDAPDFNAVLLQDSDDDAGYVGDDTLNDEASEPEIADDEPALDGSDAEVTNGEEEGESSEDESESDSDGEDENENPNLIKKRKRNDPEAFATSMSKILGSKLSSSKRSDPVLARSAAALQASKEITDLALEKKAKRSLKEERKVALEKGRVKDVLGASTAFDAATSMQEGREKGDAMTMQETRDAEKALRKTAQRGVVKLFNAVREAQIRGEKAAREARQQGVVGFARREEKVNEMSKKGFLELIAGGGNMGGMKVQGKVEEA